MSNYRPKKVMRPIRVWLAPGDQFTHSYIILSGENNYYSLSIGDCARKVTLEFNINERDKKYALAKLARIEKVLVELRKRLEAE